MLTKMPRTNHSWQPRTKIILSRKHDRIEHVCQDKRLYLPIIPSTRQGMPMPVEPSTFEFLEPAQTSDELGRIGPYSVLELIGEGGMGAVFRARDNRLKRNVALKTMRKKWANSAVGRKRFVEEARSMAAVQHDNVATVFEVGVHEGTPFLAMEMLEGKPLNQLIKENQRFSQDEIFRLAMEVTSGLAAAHQRGIIHRDIKPANIWIESPSGRAKILDFGLAIAGGHFDRFSHRGSVLGSPAYLSPEQSRGEPLDDRSDLYSLGVVLYQVCAGKPPLLCKTVPEQLIANICEAPVSLQSLKPDLPSPLCDLIHQLLEKEPRNRPKTATSLAKRILESRELCERQSNAALQIVTKEPSINTESPKPTTTTTLGSGLEKPTKPKKSLSQLYVTITITALLIFIFILWNRSEERIASELVKETTNTVEPKKILRVSPQSVKPLTIDLISEELSFQIPNAAIFSLSIKNGSKSRKEDPKNLFASNDTVVQVTTLLSPTGSNEIIRPAFAVKFSPKRLPSQGKIEKFNIQILTNDLKPDTYNLIFELQTPNGESIQRIDQPFTLTEP